ncbi:MAG: sigma-70 family RNA polymerase sigma factor [Planctomycetota bacterium]
MGAERGGDTCWSLIQRAADGDATARSSFGRSYLPLVRAFLVQRWRGTPLVHEVDDAVQEAFVDCFRPGGPLTRAEAASGDFRGFLFGVVRHVALRFEERGRAAHARASLELPEDLADDAIGVSRVFDRQWALTLMREAAAEMSREASDDAARLRVELLRLRFGSDVPVREIAERWGMDADAVHRAYARARDEFRACLRRVVAFHSVRTEAELDDECRRLLALLSPDA